MIELKNVSYKVEGINPVEIIKNLSFEFMDNKIYVITGPNGGGKSSLAKLQASSSVNLLTKVTGTCKIMQINIASSGKHPGV